MGFKVSSAKWKGKSVGFDLCDRSRELYMWPLHVTGDLGKHLVYFFALCTPFHNRLWIETGFKIRKRLNRIQTVDFPVRMTLKLTYDL